MTETSAVESSGLLDKTVTQYTVSSYLMAGQLYVVNVISHVKLTNISTRIAEQSKDATVRLGMRMILLDIYLFQILISCSTH